MVAVVPCVVWCKDILRIACHLGRVGFLKFYKTFVASGSRRRSLLVSCSFTSKEPNVQYTKYCILYQQGGGYCEYSACFAGITLTPCFALTLKIQITHCI